MLGATKPGIRRGNAIKARAGATKHMSRESGTAAFFRNLQKQGLGTNENVAGSQGHMRGQSMANSA